jgi:hypothetical protein
MVEKIKVWRTVYIASTGKLPIKFEFTDTTLHKEIILAEVGLATNAAMGRSMMSAAKVPKELCQIFWQEAFQT